jgi:hypothetical protein
LSFNHNASGVGKTQLNGHFGQIGRQVMDYVHSGHNMSTPQEAFKSLCYHSGIAGSVPTLMDCAPDLPFKSTNFPNISRVYNLQYLENGDILTFEAAGVGSGYRITKNEVSKLIGLDTGTNLELKNLNA